MGERPTQPALRTADCHNDLLLGVLHQRERGLEDPFGDFWLPQLQAGGVVVQVLPIYIEEQFVGEGALRRSMLLVEEAWRIATEHAEHVRICLTGADIHEAIDQGRIALILALEGSEPIGNDLALLQVFHRLGLRMMALSWNRRTMMADGVGERDTGGRLTRLGVDAIAEMEHLGIVLDVSHLSESGFWHVDEVATKPYIASHSSCRALQDHPRNLRDAQLEAVAASGGFVALNAFGAFLADEPSVTAFLAHVQHAVDLIGADRVALGNDFIYDLSTVVDPILGGALIDIQDLPWVEDLLRPADLAELAGRLHATLGASDGEAVAWKTLAHRLAHLLP